jgi:hypothetical protein
MAAETGAIAADWPSLVEFGRVLRGRRGLGHSPSRVLLLPGNPHESLLAGK